MYVLYVYMCMYTVYMHIWMYVDMDPLGIYRPGYSEILAVRTPQEEELIYGNPIEVTP